MICFASQRGSGEDLATHLLNEHDNEYMEFAEIRGSVADDLHGAFAEWKLQAETLTKCENYLYSLSINPDHTQGEFTREQYQDFLERMEEKLGLSHQPRALVYHIKHGREHCHAIYSRIDVESEKAVHMAFDKDKLMMVTRQFARDHGLTLPDGYYKGRGQHEGKEPLSLYEKMQQEESGLTKEQRIAKVTEIWQRSDSAKAFIAGLEEAGYVLCTGKRDYVLVDYYGSMNSLPKLIDDKQVRTKQLREFLGKDFPKDNLPDVEEARKLIAEHRKLHEHHDKSERQNEQLAQLKQLQQERQGKLELEKQSWLKNQAQKRTVLLAAQQEKRQEIKQGFDAKQSSINKQREAKKLTGLSAKLAKLTGWHYLQREFHSYQDRKRVEQFEHQRQTLLIEQQSQRNIFEQGQTLKQLGFERKEKALELIEQRELKSFNTQNIQDSRVKQRGRSDHMPALALHLKPPGRQPMVYRAKQRHASELAKALARANEEQRQQQRQDLDNERDDSRKR